MKKVFLYLLISTVISAITFAEDELIKIDDIIISATRTTSSLDKISTSSSVISEKQINSSNINDLSDLLSMTNIVQTIDYGTGSLSTISLRGSTSSQVLVLIDGKRLNDSRNGLVNLDLIPASNIKRVEIIRGGQSAIYGADAVGGIINIITKQPKYSSIKASSNLGSYGMQSYSIDASKQINSFGGLLSLSRTTSKSDFSYKNKFGESLIRKNAEYAKRNMFAKLAWSISQSAKLEMSANHFYSDAGTPGMIGLYTPKANEKDKTNDLSINFEHEVLPLISYKFSAYNRYAFMRYIDPTYPYPSDDTHKVISKCAELQTNLFKATKYPLVGGLLILNEDVDSTAVKERERRTYSGYIQQEIGKEFNLKLNRISLFPAIRYDHYSDFDAGLSPKIGFLTSFMDMFYLRANIGKSYRAPTMNDLYWPSSAMTSGNPKLKPERSNDADLGIQLNLSKFCNISLIWAGASYFQNNISDGIQWSPSQNGKWIPINFSKIKNKGIEAELHIKVSLMDIPDLFSLDINYTFLNAKDMLERQIIYRPKHSIGYTVRIGNENFWCQVNGLHQSKRYYTTENTKWLEPFMKHGLQIGTERRMWKDSKLGLIIELKNAFNTDYQLSADYPMPGREWSFKLFIGLEGE